MQRFFKRKEIDHIEGFDEFMMYCSLVPHTLYSSAFERRVCKILGGRQLSNKDDGDINVDGRVLEVKLCMINLYDSKNKPNWKQIRLHHNIDFFLLYFYDYKTHELGAFALTSEGVKEVMSECFTHGRKHDMRININAERNIIMRCFPNIDYKWSEYASQYNREFKSICANSITMSIENDIFSDR